MNSTAEESRHSRRLTFTPKEDKKLMKLVASCGSSVNWKTISIEMDGRTPRQCKERYNNYLSPEINKAQWTPIEDKVIMDEHFKSGNSWQKISGMLSGRTAGSVRNRYYYLIRRMGIPEASIAVKNIADELNRTDDFKESECEVGYKGPKFNILSDSIFAEAK
ncbi:Myb-like DNA-binding domain containing protein [Trichomonas vaginalis G3]|uniref:Myb-like DNA-binding domain containing protein n=1 Tax=Trichomonas vaginalis (strain ATCC PRA-98 / G3) TaxID=412133 RepID=A2GRM7_TRIV3|nr:RNA polymerase II transcription regulator recruiting protein [Trichomonas vaginalis G3]EAX80191.1 Myb-like DNA-binding domain containing protein [Trichomonas vaginalis G3]KAI5508235.1 RNA polymerase II transcription regulator recruiting protein [Trichomonas vaginalis G3]|eukprot:XP_001293121.1 Myb-like DNA-binding domain containing protein [Trichomonas vaginalis G3]